MPAEPKPFIDLGPAALGDAAGTAELEWLSTNGLGGYAYGTVSGALQRRWHGLLVAATDPPAGRTLLVPKIEIAAISGGERLELTANQWASGMAAPGLAHLRRVWLDGSILVREWKVGAAILEERVAMARGRNATAVMLSLRGGAEAVELELKCMVNHRPHDRLTAPGAFAPRIERSERGLRVTIDHAQGEGREIHLQVDGGVGAPDGAWYANYALPVEASLGYDSVDAHCCAGVIRLPLAPGESRGFTASTRGEPAGEGRRIIDAAAARDGALVAKAKAANDPRRARLVLSADQFVVERSLPDGTRGTSVIAGYPWFADWSRDALISLPGLLLETGRFDEAASLLRSLARFEKDGLLPNRFPAPGEAWMDNSVDAPLLLALAARRAVDATHDFDLARDLFPTLARIIDAFTRGTRHGIRVDAADGMVIASEPGTQLTWMDAKIGPRVVTPRMGKPVEINSLWCVMLDTLAAWAPRLKRDPAPFTTALAKAQKSFARFILPSGDQLADALDGPEGADASLRPNQLFAIQPFVRLMPEATARAVVARVERELLTPLGLRTLAPGAPGYIGRFGGAVEARDEAYHNGTVWPWLLAPLGCARRCIGLGRIPAEVRDALARQLSRGCLGQIFEVADGDPPQRGGGCAAQAWSVAALLDQGVGEAAGSAP
jgi:predicted glycogen debranching enzyme